MSKQQGQTKILKRETEIMGYQVVSHRSPPTPTINGSDET